MVWSGNNSFSSSWYSQDGFPDFQDAVQSYYQQDSVKIQHALSKGKCEELAALGSQVNRLATSDRLSLVIICFRAAPLFLPGHVVSVLQFKRFFDLAVIVSLLMWVCDSWSHYKRLLHTAVHAFVIGKWRLLTGMERDKYEPSDWSEWDVLALGAFCSI